MSEMRGENEIAEVIGKMKTAPDNRAIPLCNSILREIAKKGTASRD
jgi:hypothetical protein